MFPCNGHGVGVLLLHVLIGPFPLQWSLIDFAKWIARLVFLFDVLDELLGQHGTKILLDMLLDPVHFTPLNSIENPE
jgi:hypothetical protein